MLGEPHAGPGEPASRAQIDKLEQELADIKQILMARQEKA